MLPVDILSIAQIEAVVKSLHHYGCRYFCMKVKPLMKGFFNIFEDVFTDFVLISMVFMEIVKNQKFFSVMKILIFPKISVIMLL